MDDSPPPPPHLRRRLERLQAQAAERQRQEAQRGCPHTAPRQEWVARFADGSLHLYEGCSACGRNMGGRFLPVHNTDLTRLPVGMDRMWDSPPCVVCGEHGTQIHHFAPREVFGDEADLWPTAYLCTGCHAAWHARIEAHFANAPRLRGRGA